MTENTVYPLSIQGTLRKLHPLFCCGSIILIILKAICGKVFFCALFALSALVRFRIMENGHLQIRGIKKTDEGTYNCEARVMARGEIDFKTIKVVVNGKRYISVTFSFPCPVV